MYSWQLKGWPHFTFDRSLLNARLITYAERLNFLLGTLHGLDISDRLAITSHQLSIEGKYSSRIEGVELRLEELQKSVLNNLRPDLGFRNVSDRRASNLAVIISQNHQRFTTALTEKTLFNWHGLLLEHRSDLNIVGAYRRSSQPMQIVSGSFGNEVVHYEAPPSGQVANMMETFIDWFNRTEVEYAGTGPSVLRAGIAHLYFEMIHPFEDGNGRIGRVIAEKALAQGIATPLPYSLSYAIAQATNSYYSALQKVNTGLDITTWLSYFLDTCLQAVDRAQEVYAFTRFKIDYLKKFGADLSPQQQKAVLRMFEAGPEGFRGGMTAKKYRHLTRVSAATASRDLADLARSGALLRRGAGRSTHYVLPELLREG